MITAIAFVFAAGAGALARSEVNRRWNQPGGLAAGTLMVNSTGSFLLGLTTNWTGPDFTIVGIGALGTLTTFSTLAGDILVALERRRTALAVAYTAATLAIGILAAAAGMALS